MRVRTDTRKRKGAGVGRIICMASITAVTLAFCACGSKSEDQAGEKDDTFAEATVDEKEEMQTESEFETPSVEETSEEVISEEPSEPEEGSSEEEVTELNGIRLDGYYTYFEEGTSDDSLYVFRFLPDGKVISTSMYLEKGELGYPNQRWFTLENGEDLDSSYSMFIGVGEVTFDGDNISFSEVNEHYLDGEYENVTVDYTGKIDGDTLVLDSYSHYNGHTRDGEIYTFISFDDITEWK